MMARAKSVTDLAEVVDRHLRKARIGSPGARTLGRLFEVIYFASLKTEEGKPLQIRIAWVDPGNPDPAAPPRIRPNRWKIFRMAERVPLTVPNLAKLSKAADPWSSCLAAYSDSAGEFFVWGLIDQTVHFNTMLVRETEGSFAPAGLFHVLTTAAADLTVYCGRVFVARLAQDALLQRQTDVFGSGPISDRISGAVQRYIGAVLTSSEIDDAVTPDGPAIGLLADKWISTLCRILISIQRYRHGGALLISDGTAELDIKYRIDYTRLPTALINLGVASINAWEARDRIVTRCLNRRRQNIPTRLYLSEAVATGDQEDLEDEITGAVRFISSLSCVDGLILASPDLSIKGFGVEILSKKEVDSAYLSLGPGASAATLRAIDPSHYGTRHRSMMRYCMAHPTSVGFVISQDGEIRSITRVKKRLVMWENVRVTALVPPYYKSRRP